MKAWIIGLGLAIVVAGGQAASAQQGPVNMALQNGTVFQESGPLQTATFSVGAVPSPDQAGLAEWTMVPSPRGVYVQNVATGGFLAAQPGGLMLESGSPTSEREWLKVTPTDTAPHGHAQTISVFRLQHIDSGLFLGPNGTLVPQATAALWHPAAPFDPASEDFVRLENTAHRGRFINAQHQALAVGPILGAWTSARWVTSIRPDANGHQGIAFKNVQTQTYLNATPGGVSLGPLTINPQGGGASVWLKMAQSNGTGVTGFTFVAADLNRALQAQQGSLSLASGTTGTVFSLNTPAAAPAAVDTSQFSRLHSVLGLYAQTGLKCGPLPADKNGADWRIIRFGQAPSGTTVVIVNRKSNRSLSVQNGKLSPGAATPNPDGTGPNVWIMETVGSGPSFKLRNQTSGQYLAVGKTRPDGTAPYFLGPGLQTQSQWTLEPTASR